MRSFIENYESQGKCYRVISMSLNFTANHNKTKTVIELLI